MELSENIFLKSTVCALTLYLFTAFATELIDLVRVFIVSFAILYLAIYKIKSNI